MEASENKNPLPIRPTIFLDTNALHYIFSYLRLAKELDLPPYQNSQYDKVKDALRRRLPKGIADKVMDGAKTLAFLQQQKEQDAEIWTSRFAKAEILYGSLEGRVHVRLAREGVIYRMRQRLGTLSELVSMYLEPTDSEAIVREWDEMVSLLEERGRIAIEFAENVIDSRRIAEIAECLQSRVFVDVLDSWMYGCAVALQADRIVTFDRYFRNVINRIHNPQKDAEWEGVRFEILAKLGDLFPVRTSVDLSLPKVQALPNGIPSSWGGNHA